MNKNLKDWLFFKTDSQIVYMYDSTSATKSATFSREVKSL